MTENMKIDARGLSCPEPVLALKRVLDSKPAGPVTILVDTVTSRENVTRFAENMGRKVEAIAEEDHFRLVLK